jgi:hypothetical protein
MSRGQDKLLAPQGLARNKSNTPWIMATALEILSAPPVQIKKKNFSGKTTHAWPSMV